MSSSPAKPSLAHSLPMFWSAVVKKPAPEKKPIAAMQPPVLDDLVPAQQPPPADHRTPVPPGSMSYTQAHTHISAGRAGLLPEARVDFIQAGLVDRPPVAPARPHRAGGVVPTGSVHPVTASGNMTYYPQARTDTPPPAKITRTFANEATQHSSSERRVNIERSKTATTTSFALINARLQAAAVGAQAARNGTNNAANEINAALPVHSGNYLVATARQSTISGLSIVNTTSGGNLAFETHNEMNIGPSPASVIGSERYSGTLVLSHVPQRRILAVTLSLLRSSVAARMVQDSQYKIIMDFLDRVVPVGSGVPEYDNWMPSIVIAYRYPIDDGEWEIFEVIVSKVKLARDAEKVLGSSAAELDQVNVNFLSAELMPLKKPADEQIRDLVNWFNLY